MHSGDTGELGLEMRDRAQVRIIRVEIIESAAEKSEQFGALQAAGVDFAQGYLFGRPVPHAELDLGPQCQWQRTSLEGRGIQSARVS